MRLIKVSLEPPEGLEAFLIELGAGENGFGGTDYAADKETLLQFLRRFVDMSEGRNLREGWVQSTTFWLLDDAGRIAGMCRLRHVLNDELLHHGGHIGYYIRPSHRGQGYGTAILARVLEEGRAMGLHRFLLTVHSDNQPSIRVIEGNGGVMEDERLEHETGLPFRRYWIG